MNLVLKGHWSRTTWIEECCCFILQGIVCEAARKSWLEPWEQSEPRRETRTDEEDLHRHGLFIHQRRCKEETIMSLRYVHITELVFVGFKWKLAHDILCGSYRCSHRVTSNICKIFIFWSKIFFFDTALCVFHLLSRCEVTIGTQKCLK